MSAVEYSLQIYLQVRARETYDVNVANCCDYDCLQQQ
jgi:hypothetical protein